jgi:hypothetical protein
MKERYEFTLSAKKEIMPTRTLQPYKTWTVQALKAEPQVLVDRTQHPPFLHPTPLFHFFISMA